MYILTQDSKTIIDSEYVSRFFIDSNPDKTVFSLIAKADETILLGTYPKLDQAVTALKYIGVCIVDEDAQGKITVVPSREDMAFNDELSSGDMPSSDILEKLMEMFEGGYECRQCPVRMGLMP